MLRGPPLDILRGPKRFLKINNFCPKLQEISNVWKAKVGKKSFLYGDWSEKYRYVPAKEKFQESLALDQINYSISLN